MLAEQSLKRSKILIGQSMTGDIDQLVKLKLCKKSWLKGEDIFDTLIMAKMINENRGKYDLETLLLEEANVHPWKQDTEVFSKVDATAWPAKLRQERCRLDAWASAYLYEKYRENPQLHGPLRYNHKIALTLHRIYHAGAAVDMGYYEKLRKELKSEADSAKDLLLKAARRRGMSEFCPTNDGDIRTLIYDKCGAKIEKRTKKGNQASVDKLSLSLVLKKNPKLKEIEYLLQYNAADTLYRLNIEGIKDKIVPIDPKLGLIHFRINPFGARTGRRSSSKPNSQNWNTRVRQMLVSRWKKGLIGDHDYSKLEPVLVAWLAGDEKMLKYFMDPKLGYIGVAKELFDKTVDKNSVEYRLTKSVVLGTNYNMHFYKLAHDLKDKMGVMLAPRWDDHVDRCEEIQKLYFKKFPKLKEWMRDRKEEVLENGYILGVGDQHRRLPCPDGEDTPGFKHKHNQSINYPVQWFAACVAGCAMIEVEQELLRAYNLPIDQFHTMLLERRWAEHPMTLMVNEVHDDIVTDYHPAHQKRDQDIIVNVMRKPSLLRKMVPEFDLTLNVDANVHVRWGCKS